ncbi:MAG: MmcQ/YjbR family DNA-binding protein, partial [Bacteroidota bacterium]
MTLDIIRNYCLNKPGRITEGFPFGEGALVYKVNGKMFLLIMADEKPLSMNLKSDPEQAIEWRERFEAVQPGYHMNK